MTILSTQIYDLSFMIYDFSFMTFSSTQMATECL